MEIILESELEKVAGGLNACECQKLAEVYRRWAFDLDAKAFLLTCHLARRQPFRRRRKRQQSDAALN
jgi:hypothetical protein